MPRAEGWAAACVQPGCFAFHPPRAIGIWAVSPSMGVVTVRVNVDNFARAESDRMFAAVAADAGSVNQWLHYRAPTPLDRQTVIRMNRDTLYSAAVVDISADATLSIPDAGSRYLSVMVVNQDHYVNKIFHEPGEHDLAVEEFGTPYVVAAARVLVDPGDPGDVASVNVVQDQFGLRAGSARPFVPPDYDQPSLDATRAALLELAKGLGGFDRAFGARQDVDPGAPPDRGGGRVGRAARTGGLLRQRQPGPAGRRIPAHR